MSVLLSHSIYSVWHIVGTQSEIVEERKGGEEGIEVMIWLSERTEPKGECFRVILWDYGKNSNTSSKHSINHSVVLLT